MATISKIKNGSTNYQLVGSPRYATCTTAAGTVAKVAALADSTSALTLEAGVRICVKFSNANTAASPTLNVASTGAKAIYWHGAALASGQYWQANAVLDFLYNGTQWELVGVAKDNNTTYSNFVKSGSGAKTGLVPAPSTTAGTTKYLREDCTWQVPPDTNTTYTFETGDSNGQIKVTPSGGSAQNVSVKGLGTAAYTASTAYATAAQGTLASNALPKSGGTMTGNITMDNSASVQSGEPYIQWATVGTNKPYTGFAHDQSDGTFIICSMEKDTTTNGVKYYRNGLAIGGGSGNLFWKGAKVATVDDIPTIPADKYHKTGSWSGLTYTATAVNNAEELKFTIPTGTSSTTVSAGNHTHTSYAPKASPTFTGTPKAPTAAAGTNTTQIATTAFVTTAVSGAKGVKISTSSTQPTGQASGDYWYKIL